MLLEKQKPVIPYMKLEDRKKYLSKKNVCSIEPALSESDYLFTGNGLTRIDTAGNPFREEIIITQEQLYEPLWAETPLPPDLSTSIGKIREYVLSGNPDAADALIEEAQRKAGYGKYMNLDAKIVYPIGSPRVHKAFSLSCERKMKGGEKNYLRWLDMLTGKTVAYWEDESGSYKTETLPVFKDDYVLIRFSAPKGRLTLDIDLKLPGGPNVFGIPTMVGAEHTLASSKEGFTLSWGYNPEFGKKGYVAILKFDYADGEITLKEQGIHIERGSEFTIAAKAIPVMDGFFFGCEKEYEKEFANIEFNFDNAEEINRQILGKKMLLSEISLADESDLYLSGEELLEKCHSVDELYPAMLEKLYDMGRFYQIIDTGKIPPMWGQHNINTNLQVCAGNNTGLFEEMDSYFRYYETKFEDFRINAKRLFGARGLLASVHCDPDSGLFYHFSKTYPHYCFTGVLGWVYNEFWGYYLCTGDKDFLRNRIIPALKEIAVFFEDYACERDKKGKSIFVPSFSPEDPTPNPDYSTVTCKDIHATRINSVMDIAICREVLTNLIEGCRVLNIETEMIPHWEKQLEELPVYLADSEGGLKEWAWPSMEENYNHRHVSHHYDLWPGRAVTVDKEPEIARAILVSNRKRGQQDDSAHGIIHRTFCAIRLKDKEEAWQNLSQLISHGFVRANLSTAHFPYRGQFPDLQGAMPAILLEMCIYSEPGMIELLPSLVPSMKKGSIRGVWLYTFAKLESLTWGNNEAVAEITSFKDQVLSFRLRGAKQKISINGKSMNVTDGMAEYSIKTGEKALVKLTGYEE